MLKAAEYGQRDLVAIVRRDQCERLAVALAASRLDRHRVGDRDERRARIRASSLDHAPRTGVAHEAHERDAGLRDAGLVAGDVLDGVAENVRVVERNVGDDGDLRPQHVGSVERAADAGFDHRNVDFGTREPQEREREQRLVVRRPAVFEADAVDGTLHLTDEVAERVLRDREPVDARALRHAREVRLRVQSRALAGRLQRRGDHRRRRTLAARPCNVNRRICVLRVAERF